MFVAPSCSACPQAVPPYPLPSCYAITSTPPPPPQPDPVALPWPGTNRPSYLFLCKKTRGSGPLQACQTRLGNKHSSQSLAHPELLSPVCCCQHLNTAAVSVTSEHFIKGSAFLSALKTFLSSLTQGRGVDDTKYEMQLSVSVLSTVRAKS